jgi:hypothetical protein
LIAKVSDCDFIFCAITSVRDSENVKSKMDFISSSSCLWVCPAEKQKCFQSLKRNGVCVWMYLRWMVLLRMARLLGFNHFLIIREIISKKSKSVRACTSID